MYASRFNRRTLPACRSRRGSSVCNFLRYGRRVNRFGRGHSQRLKGHTKPVPLGLGHVNGGAVPAPRSVEFSPQPGRTGAVPLQCERQSTVGTTAYEGKAAGRTPLHLNLNLSSMGSTRLVRAPSVKLLDTRCFPSLDYCDSILIYKEVLRLRPSVQGDPFFGRRRRWSSEHHETDSAYCVPRAGVGDV